MSVSDLISQSQELGEELISVSAECKVLTNITEKISRKVGKARPTLELLISFHAEADKSTSRRLSIMLRSYVSILGSGLEFIKALDKKFLLTKMLNSDQHKKALYGLLQEIEQVQFELEVEAERCNKGKTEVNEGDKSGEVKVDDSNKGLSGSQSLSNLTVNNINQAPSPPSSKTHQSPPQSIGSTYQPASSTISNKESVSSTVSVDQSLTSLASGNLTSVSIETDSLLNKPALPIPTQSSPPASLANRPPMNLPSQPITTNPHQSPSPSNGTTSGASNLSGNIYPSYTSPPQSNSTSTDSPCLPVNIPPIHTSPPSSNGSKLNSSHLSGATYPGYTSPPNSNTSSLYNNPPTSGQYNPNLFGNSVPNYTYLNQECKNNSNSIPISSSDSKINYQGNVDQDAKSQSTPYPNSGGNQSLPNTPIATQSFAQPPTSGKSDYSTHSIQSNLSNFSLNSGSDSIKEIEPYLNTHFTPQSFIKITNSTPINSANHISTQCTVQFPNTPSPLPVQIKTFKTNPVSLKLMAQEAKNVINLQGSPYIVRFIGICFTLEPVPPTSYAYSDLIESTTTGTLIQALNSTRLLIGWDSKMTVLEDLINGLVYLHHSKFIIHGNLNPSSILITNEGRVKITGFEFACPIDNKSNISMLASLDKSQTISSDILRWLDPYHYNHPNLPITVKSDIYSFALVLFYLFTSSLPFKNSDSQQILSLFGSYQSENLNGLSDRFHQAVNKCWNSNPLERPSSQDLLGLINNQNAPNHYQNRPNIVPHFPEPSIRPTLPPAPTFMMMPTIGPNPSHNFSLNTQPPLQNHNPNQQYYQNMLPKGYGQHSKPHTPFATPTSIPTSPTHNKLQSNGMNTNADCSPNPMMQFPASPTFPNSSTYSNLLPTSPANPYSNQYTPSPVYSNQFPMPNQAPTKQSIQTYNTNSSNSGLGSNSNQPDLSYLPNSNLTSNTKTNSVPPLPPRKQH